MEKYSQWVAVVDDDDAIRRALLRLLRSAGIHAKAFADGTAFLDSLQSNHPYCVILDIQMPHMSGLEVQVELADRAPEIGVIFITGQHSREIQTHIVRQPSLFYLLKPIDDNLLLNAIEMAGLRVSARPFENV